MSHNGIIASDDNFAYFLYRYCTKNIPNSKNIIISPLSIQTALSLALIAASGQAGAYANQSEKIKAETVYLARKYFLMESDQLGCHPEQCFEAVNEWFKERDGIMEFEFIQPLACDLATRILVINSIYLKGSWHRPFTIKQTKRKNFYINERDYVPVDMMQVMGTFNYGYIRSINAQIIEFPYSNSNVAMTVVLPIKRCGLEELEADMERINLSDLNQQMKTRAVMVDFPKLSFESMIDVKHTLAELGMPSSFSNVQIQGTTTGRYSAANVYHRSHIDLNEFGVEVYTLQSDIETISRLTRNKETFTCDHPFWFAIRQDSVIIVAGRFVGEKSY